MPKVPIDYSKTIMYKIVCNDLEIKDCYVGHTTNFIKRKIGHKTDCYNEQRNKYNLKVYQIIRENGGWDNWSMVQIEEYNCKDKREAEKRERELYEDLGATLNSQVPMRTQEEINNCYTTYKDYYKKYADTHKDEILLNHKKYYETHKEERKQYLINNKEHITEQRKKWNEKNKEHIKELKNKIGCCDICGLEMLKRSISRHKERKHNL